MLKQMYHGLQYKFSDTQQVQRSSQAPTRKELAACRGAGGVQVERRRRRRSPGHEMMRRGGVQAPRECDRSGKKWGDTNRRDPTCEYGESKIANLLVYPTF